MASIYDAVTDRPIPADEPFACPKCSSTDVHREGKWTTLVGGPAGVNHEWSGCTCRACGLEFCFEERVGNAWYTAGRHHHDGPRVLLRGVPSCFEPYVYHCARCPAGLVYREYRRLDTGEIVTTIGYTIRADGQAYDRDHRIVFVCEGCGRETETDDEYPVHRRSA